MKISIAQFVLEDRDKFHSSCDDGLTLYVQVGDCPEMFLDLLSVHINKNNFKSSK